MNGSLNKNLHEFNENNANIHQMFSKIAHAQPKATALIWHNKLFTYSDLDNASDNCAKELMNLGIGPGSYVPIVLPRSIDLIVALISVLKTGAAYVLIDPNWPLERKLKILEILQNSLTITAVDECLGETIKYTIQTNCKLKNTASTFTPIIVDAYSPSCIFFTSGTSGQPKGVVSPHRALIRLFCKPTFAHFSSQTIIPLSASIAWDAFSLELWGALLNGGAAWILDEPYLSGNLLYKGIKQHKINTIWMTSSLFNMVVEENLEAFAGLKQVMIGGERLSIQHVKKFLIQYPSITLINGYGPVESTVFATTHSIKLMDCSRSDGIPIGLPVPGTQVYVINENKICSEGERGEICIAGEGLALHYLNDPNLTRIKFITADIKGSPTRLYLTGDYGYWKDGLLHFIGRMDRQVKVRGHRIELSDLEHQIVLLSQIRECKVLAVKDPKNISDVLVAFCIPKKPGDKLENLLALLKLKLTSYMCPTIIIPLNIFPLTPQGKLDENELLKMIALPVEDMNIQKRFSNCLDSLTGTVIKTVQEVLKNSFVPLNTSFFDLGATSLDIGRICARLSSYFNTTIPLSWLYQKPTVASLTEKLENMDIKIAKKTKDEANKTVLNSMQKVFLTKYLYHPENLSSHCLMSWIINGKLERDLLERSIQHLHHKHAFLRSAYIPDPIPYMCLLDIEPPPLEVFADQPSVEKGLNVLKEEFSVPLDPTSGDVWRAALVKIDDNTYIFGCIIHHIAFDGWSEFLLARDLTEAYNNFKNEETLSLSPCFLENTYRASEAFIKSIDLSAHDEYLISEYSNIPRLNWPSYKENLNLDTQKCKEISFLISKELVSLLDKAVTNINVSRFDILLYSWSKSISEALNQNDFCIGIPVRQRSVLDLQDVIGCYINMICVRMRNEALSNGVNGIKETRNIIQKALSVQEVSLEHILQITNTKNSSESKNGGSIFQTIFALQDNPLPQLKFLNLDCKFVRQPYFDLPVDVHAEVWSEDNGELRLTISFRSHFISEMYIHKLAHYFFEFLNENVMCQILEETNKTNKMEMVAQ